MPEPSKPENQAQAKPAPCFARRHMSMAASAYHSYAFGVSRTSGVFYSDDRRDAEDFGVSNKTIWKLRTQLEKDGWFLPLTRGSRRKRNPVTGHWLAVRYRILSHDEWAATHPGKCRCLKSPDVESTSGPDVESTSGDNPPDVETTHAGRTFVQTPDVVSTAKVVDSRLKGEQVRTSAANPAAPVVLPEWLPAAEWNDFLAFRKERKKPLNPTARKYTLQRLDDLRLAGHDPAAVLRQSIERGWTGLFPLPDQTLDANTRDQRNLAALGLRPFNPANVTTKHHEERMRKNAITLGLVCALCNQPTPCHCPKH